MLKSEGRRLKGNFGDWLTLLGSNKKGYAVGFHEDNAFDLLGTATKPPGQIISRLLEEL